MNHSQCPAGGVPAPKNDNGHINKLKRAFAYKLFYQLGKTVMSVSLNDYYLAVSSTLRDRMQLLFINSTEALLEKKIRTVCYLSAEFLMGPHLCNNLVSMGLFEDFLQATQETGLDLKAIIDHEEEPGLGNGGLGRLAACYLDSLATLQIPAIGYGIRYEFGMFDQEIENGWQKELSDPWLQQKSLGDQKARSGPEGRLRGFVETYKNHDHKNCLRWVPAREVIAIPYDTPVRLQGQHGQHASAVERRATKSFDFRTLTSATISVRWVKKSPPKTSPGTLSQRQAVSGQAASAGTAVFFVSSSWDMIRMHFFENSRWTTFTKLTPFSSTTRTGGGRA